MRALTFQGPERIEHLTELPDPEIRDPGDAVVAVHRAGLCGSDLHAYHGREALRPGTIPGHEFTGEIVAVGDAVRRHRVGDRVFGPFSTSCGDCPACRRGLSARCRSGALFGYRPPSDEEGVGPGRWLDGAQAELLRVPLADGTLLHRPPELSEEQAILLGDNFTTGWHCAEQAGLPPGGLAVVLGCGAVGLSAIVAARRLGAGTVLAVDPVPGRRERAESLGASSATPESAAELVAELAGAGDRGGADAVLEAVGGPAAQRLAFDLLRTGGVLSSVGVQVGPQFAFSPGEAYDRNVSYRSGRCPVRSLLDRLLPLVLAGELEIPVDRLVDPQVLPLADGAEAYRRFAQRRGDGRKILLDPTRAGRAALR